MKITHLIFSILIMGLTGCVSTRNDAALSMLEQMARLEEQTQNALEKPKAVKKGIVLGLDDEGIREASRLGFIEWVADEETGIPVYRWKTELLGNQNPPNVVERPRTFVPENTIKARKPFVVKDSPLIDPGQIPMP